MNTLLFSWRVVGFGNVFCCVERTQRRRRGEKKTTTTKEFRILWNLAASVAVAFTLFSKILFVRCFCIVIIIII